MVFHIKPTLIYYLNLTLPGYTRAKKAELMWTLMLPRWPLSLAFMAQLGTLTENTRQSEQESPATLAVHTCSRPTLGNFAGIKSEYDHFNGLSSVDRYL